MSAVIDIQGLEKTYADGFQALKGVDLQIRQGEIIALLGPNGAGKTTLISCVCGLAEPTGGTITVGGHDLKAQFREARSLIGLVPQEMSIEPFEKVINTTRLSRGLFGLSRDDAHIEKILRALTLWEKRDSRVVELSGGMKRRVMIAKALSHEPQILFLDEPTAGVDVELRREMWALVNELNAAGTTIILTTHYIEEAEEMADRIAVINKGEIQLVEDKATLMAKLGGKTVSLALAEPITALPPDLPESLSLGQDGRTILYTYDSRAGRTGVRSIMNRLDAAGLVVADLETRQKSLEDIFVDLVADKGDAA